MKSKFLKALFTKTPKKSGRISVSTNQTLDDGYLFDFKNYSSQYNGGFDGGTRLFMPTSRLVNGEVAREFSAETDQDIETMKKFGKIPEKIKVRPIDVLNELETVPTPFSLALIDEKLQMLKDKEKLIVQSYAKREVSALIERLENRKKYQKHKAFFDSFQNTTDEKIEMLTSKYELVMKASDIFVPEFPDEAIAVMKEYTAITSLICEKKPVFYVIAEEKDFKKAYEKRDPILLVQSPFGFFWQILGAWGDEMLILGEM